MKPHRPNAFTLAEAILTIAIIGILSSLIITSISNINADAARLVGRQQQAAVQSAVNAWVNSQTRTNDSDPNAPRFRSTEDIRADYNSRGHSRARLNLISPYLDDATFLHFEDYTTSTSQIKSEALTKVRQHLTLDVWGASNYPRVSLGND
jgi:type II secretory pathway pseudopilin PulG